VGPRVGVDAVDKKLNTARNRTPAVWPVAHHYADWAFPTPAEGKGKGKGKGKVVPVLNLIKHYAVKAYGGVDV
jgi:hypothetical protein